MTDMFIEYLLYLFWEKNSGGQSIHYDVDIETQKICLISGIQKGSGTGG